jgi:putative GTP pyrophosphokinase
MIADYRCAALEVETKFKVLNTRLSMKNEANPIESIKTRIKSLDSILLKMEKLGLKPTLESVQKNIFDIAGVRVVCSFIDDIYTIEKYFLNQEDVKLITRKDYIENPKESGYRSLHLIIQTPIYTENGKKDMYVEVQLRTIAMDFWASLEHKLRYKKNIDPALLRELSEELESCAEESTKLDRRMLVVRKKIKEASES